MLMLALTCHSYGAWMERAFHHIERVTFHKIMGQFFFFFFFSFRNVIQTDVSKQKAKTHKTCYNSNIDILENGKPNIIQILIAEKYVFFSKVRLQIQSCDK